MSNIIKIAFLVVGAILLALIVRTVVSKTAEPTVHPVDSVKVRVSAADLPQGLLLRDDDLRWQMLPASKVPAGAIVADVPNAVEIKGALLRHPVTAGTVFVADDVILSNAPGFLAATLKPDMRAVSVAVDDVSGNAGLIEPGDYVDLLLTQTLDQQNNAPGHAVASETVVEHVRVLASGSEILRPKSNDATDSRQRARTVTLEVTPRMSEVVAVAARLGSLSLALRSFATVSRDPYALAGTVNAGSPSGDLPPPVWSKDISRALRDIPPPPVARVAPTVMPPAPHTVAIYRGSEKSEAAAGMNGSVGNGATAGIPPLPPAVAAAR